MYDIGFRIAALKLYSYFLSLRKTSKILNISISTISRWNANICIKKRNRIPVKNSEALRNFVKTQTTINPCITCPILCAKIQESFKFSVSRQLVNIIMKQVNISFAGGGCIGCLVFVQDRRHAGRRSMCKRCIKRKTIQEIQRSL